MNGPVRKRALGCLGLFVFAYVTLTALPARAVDNENFGIVPHPHNIEGRERLTFAVPLETGAVFEDAVRVYNRTDQPLNLLVYAADAESGVDGTISVGFRGSRPKGVGAWVHLSRDSIDLPPRGEALIRFRIQVRSADPLPALGSIVVENAERGIAADLAQRLQIVIRTSSPNSPTTSVRVRPLLLRSPWIIVATLGLVAAFVIIWLGARRTRRPKDRVVSTGELEKRASEPEVTPSASRPVLRRLGEESLTPAPGGRRRPVTSASRSTRAGRPERPRRRVEETDEDLPDLRPILDDMLADIDEPEPEPEPAPSRASGRNGPPKPKPRTSKTKASRAKRPAEKTKDAAGYIPLDKI